MPAAATSKSVSAKQLCANRRNARLSTGPRTEEGKARSSMNALDHGIFCKDLLLPGEDPAELQQFCDELLRDLAPRDALERSIARQYVEAKWRLRRVRRGERRVHEQVAAAIECDQGRSHVDVRLRLRGLPRMESMDLDDRRQPLRGGTPRQREDAREQRYADRRALIPADVTLAENFLGFDHSPLERLGRYEQRLELSAERALRQLHRLRKERGDGWQPPQDTPTQEPGNDAANDAVEGTPQPQCAAEARAPQSQGTSPTCAAHNRQNEPISAATPAAPDAAEGCETPPRHQVHEDARRLAPLVIQPHPVSRQSRQRAAERGD